MELGQVQFRKILNIGISLTTEKDRHKLLEKILVESMNITSADAGTLYVLEENALVFKVMKTLSMGISRGGKRGNYRFTAGSFRGTECMCLFGNSQKANPH